MTRAYSRTGRCSGPFGVFTPMGMTCPETAPACNSWHARDVVSFHRDCFGPRVSRLVLVRAVELVSARPLVERAFAGWRGGPTEAVVPPALERAPGAGKVLVVDRPDQTQAQVRLGALAYCRGERVTFPAQVMNAALGGGFTSRLVREVRVKRGLSYGVGSSFETMRAGGRFSVSSFTKVKTTQELLQVTLGRWPGCRDRGPSLVELKKAQEYLAGPSPFGWRRTRRWPVPSPTSGSTRWGGLGGLLPGSNPLGDAG